MKQDTLDSIANEPAPSPDTGPQTPCPTAMKLWRFPDAPSGYQSVLRRHGDGRDGRWAMIVPTAAIAAWETDAYDGRATPIWAVGWERMQHLVLALDHIGSPLFFSSETGILIFGCSS